MRCDTILVIEDDPAIREALCLILETEGYEVKAAENGQAGLAALSSSCGPCLILLDLMMPVMNGFEFLTARERDVTLVTIPVVIVSAFAESAEHVSSKTQGFVKKPVNLELLLDVVRRYCGPPGARAS